MKQFFRAASKTATTTRSAIRIAVIALAYFAAHKVAFLFPDAPGAAQVLMSVWPPGGVGLAAMLLSSRRLWPWILAAMFASGYAADLLAGRSALACAGFMTANVLESLGCAWLATWWCGPRIQFTRVREVLALIVGATVINAGTACIGAAAGLLATPGSFDKLWWTWWVSDGLGLLLVTPMIVAWASFRWPRRLQWGRVFELVAIPAILCAASWAVFCWRHDFYTSWLQPFMLFPLLAWSALRLSQRGVTLGTVLLATVAIASTALGDDFSPWGTQDSQQKLMLIEVYTGVMTSTALLLMASRMEGQAAQEHFRAVATHTPDHVLVQDRDLRYTMVVNPQLGLTEEGMLGKIDAEFLAPDDARRLTEVKQSVLDTGASVPFSTALRNTLGEQEYFEGSYIARRDAGGNVDGLIGYFRNVTERRAVEQALRDSQEKFSKAFLSCPEPMSIVEMDSGRYIEINEAFAQTIGFAREEIIGKTSTELKVWVGPIKREEYLRQLRAAGCVRGLEVSFRMRSGEIRDFVVSSEIVRIGDRECSLNFIFDITERKRAEQAIRSSEEKFSKMFASAPALMTISAVEDGSYLDVNDAFLKSSGLTREETIGRTSTELGWISPQDRARIVQALREHGTVSGMELNLRAKDGHTVACLYHGVIIRAGDQERLLSIAVDVSDRKAAEQAIHESEERFRKLVEQASDGFELLDENGRYLEANSASCRQLGYSKEELLRLSIPDIDPTKTLAKFREEFLSLSDGPSAVFETVHRRKDGSEFPVEVAASKIQLRGKAMVLSLVRDISERKRAAEVLAETNQRLAATLEAIPDLMFEVDGEGRFLAYNAPKKVTLYVAPEVFMGKTVREVLPKDAADAIMSALAQAAVEDSSRGAIYAMDLPQGRRWFELSIAAKGASGSGTRSFVVLARDITERSQAEQSLRESEQRYRSLVENVGLGVVVIGDDYRILSANPAQAKLFGKKPEDLIGKKCYREFEGRDAVCPECPGKRVMETGQAVTMDRVGVRSDGTTHMAMVRSFPLFDASGKATSFFEVVEDITQRVRTGDALRQSEADLAAAQRMAKIGSWQWDIRKNMARWSAETYRLFGMEIGDLNEHRTEFLDMVHPEDRLRVDKALRDAVSGASRYDLEFRIVRKDGQERLVHSQAEVLTGEDGKPSVMLGTIQDITQQRRLETQYRQSQKMEAVGRLAAGVAHDFNNQLTVIQGYADLLLRGARRDDPFREPLEQILQAAERAHSTTSHLLSFSRKQMLSAKVLDLGKVLREAVAPISRVIGEDVKFTVEAAADVPPVLIDEGGLHQALMNLVVNSRDAMPRGGTLTLSARRMLVESGGAEGFADVQPGEYALLEIADSGEGMDAKTLEQVFDPFFTTKEPGKGTGLGLPMVMGFMQQSNGFVSVRSKPGGGTTVRLLLPAASEKMADPPEPPVELPKSSLVVRTILLVEDEDGVRALATMLLKQAGHHVLAVGGPAEAMELSGRHSGRIDLLITDMVMPGMHGDELAAKLAISRPGLQTLFISGYTDHRPELAVRLLTKPFSSDELLSRVAEILE